MRKKLFPSKIIKAWGQKKFAKNTRIKMTILAISLITYLFLVGDISFSFSSAVPVIILLLTYLFYFYQYF